MLDRHGDFFVVELRAVAVVEADHLVEVVAGGGAVELRPPATLLILPVDTAAPALTELNLKFAVDRFVVERTCLPQQGLQARPVKPLRLVL